MTRRLTRMRGQSKTLLALGKRIALSAALLLVIGCGRETKIYLDPNLSNESDQAVGISDGRNSLPQDFFDLSVNHAAVALSFDLTSATSQAIRLVTWPLLHQDGSFNGTGGGNRALLGLSKYAGEKISGLGSLSFDAKSFGAKSGVDALLLIDLDCSGDPARHHALIARASALLPGSPQPNGYQRFEIKVADSKWQSLDSDIPAPSDSATTLIPMMGSLQHGSLAALSTAYPDACLANRTSVAVGLPRDLPLTGLMFSIGDAANTVYDGAFINRISVGSDVQTSADWGAR